MYFILHYTNAWVPPYTRPTHTVSLPTVQSQTNICSHIFRIVLFRQVHTSMYCGCGCTSTYSHTEHSHFISNQAPSSFRPSRVPTLVRRFASRILPFRSLLDCQAANARLVRPKLPQPRDNNIDVAALPSILRSCVCTSGRET